MGVGTQESIRHSTMGVGFVRLCTKRSCKAAHCVSSATSFFCLHHPFEFCLLDVHPKKSKKNPELKKLMGGSCYICYICEKNGCQMAGLHCNVAFHATSMTYAPTPPHRKVMMSKTCTGGGCNIVCFGKNITSCSKPPPFLPVICALCTHAHLESWQQHKWVTEGTLFHGMSHSSHPFCLLAHSSCVTS